MTIIETEHGVCSVCGEPFTDDEWDARHSDEHGGDCHDLCCPACNPNDPEHPHDCRCPECDPDHHRDLRRF